MRGEKVVSFYMNEAWRVVRNMGNLGSRLGGYGTLGGRVGGWILDLGSMWGHVPDLVED